MELIKLLEHQILEEGRLEDAINKWGGEDDQTINQIKELSKKDPSGNNKYLDWMSNQVINNNENINDVINVINDFHNLTDKITPEVVRDVFGENTVSVGLRRMLSAPTDINSYNNVKDVSKVTNLAKKMLSRREVKALSKSEAETIYDDDLFEIIVPRSYQASCHYGTGTKWCVTSRDSSHHYNDYTNRGVLFFILDKRMRARADHPLYKIAIFIEDSNPNQPQIYNALDNRLASNSSGNETLVNILPPQMIESIMSYFNRRTVVFSILNSELTKDVTLTIQNQANWSQLNDMNNIRILHESSDSVINVNLDTKKNTITFVLSNAGMTIKTIRRTLDLGLIKAITQRINYDRNIIERTPDVQETINGYFSNLTNSLLPEFNDILYQIETSQIISRNKKNVITGDFPGNWVYSVVQKPTDANQVLILNVTWPEDPDDNKLTLICYIDFLNTEFKLEGVLNLGTSERMDYDEEKSKFNPDLLSAPQRLSKVFLNWIKDKLSELLTEEDTEE